MVGTATPRHMDDDSAWCAASPPALYAAETEVLRRWRAFNEGPLGDPANALSPGRQTPGTAPARFDALARLERFMQPGFETGLRLAAAQALWIQNLRTVRPLPELAASSMSYTSRPRAMRAPRDRRSCRALATLQETRLGAPRGRFRVVRP